MTKDMTATCGAIPITAYDVDLVIAARAVFATLWGFITGAIFWRNQLTMIDYHSTNRDPLPASGKSTP